MCIRCLIKNFTEYRLITSEEGRTAPSHCTPPTLKFKSSSQSSVYLTFCRLYLCMQARVYSCLSVCICQHVCFHVSFLLFIICVCIHANTVNLFTRVRACVCVCACVCLCVCCVCVLVSRTAGGCISAYRCVGEFLSMCF